MKAAAGMKLPLGTSVYCCPLGLVLDLRWLSPRGVHIVRIQLPLTVLLPAQAAVLRAAARDFRRAVARERARS